MGIDIGVDGGQGDREREIEQAAIAAGGAVLVSLGRGRKANAAMLDYNQGEGRRACRTEEQSLDGAAIVELAPAGQHGRAQERTMRRRQGGGPSIGAGLQASVLRTDGTV